MTISTIGTARHISPTVVGTFFRHYFRQAKKSKDDRRLEATDELLFDEAFHIVKRFIALGTNDTVEALQAFTNTRIPSQPFTTLVPTLIPLSSCDQAARYLIEYFGDEDIKNVVGGERWWQVRSLDGVEAEWVAMTEDWKQAKIVEEMPDGAARARAAKEAKYNKRHERRSKNEEDDAAKLGNKSSSTTTKLKATTRATQDEDPSQEPEATTPPTEAEASAVPMGDDDDGTDGDSVPVEELDRLRRVMLYIHGGGYYFGSCNTHRYQIIRLARKMGGRAFCPNYRKAPGFPWPCPLQDCLAAWFYLTDPPPGAGHKAIDPKNIVLAGDSAGGGMCLAMLGVLRDLGLPMPAGAVLISPWCDMTHSFPSIMQNTDSDIIPPYGFIHKPSTLWPIPANAPSHNDDAAAEGSGDTEPSRHIPKTTPDSSTLPTRAGSVNGVTEGIRDGKPTASNGPSSSSQQTQHSAQTLSFNREGETSQPRSSAAPLPANTGLSSTARPGDILSAPRPLQSDPVRVELSDQPDEPIELKQQIQLYATNNQLYHPLCSPIFQGSLGGLPPLYILAGDGEVLRDEVIMLAHRAARPEKYPLPEHLLEKNKHSRLAAERFNSQPTQVHLQVFDYQCHVLTLFSFTTAARFAYRAIASFCKYVTRAETIEGGGSFSSFKDSAFPRLAPEASTSSSVFSPQTPKEERHERSGRPHSDSPAPLDTSTIGLREGLPSISTTGLNPASTFRESGSASDALLPAGHLTSSAMSSGGGDNSRSNMTNVASPASALTPATAVTTGTDTSSSSISGSASRRTTIEEPPTADASAVPSSSSSISRQGSSKVDAESLLYEKRRKVTLGRQNDYSGQVPLMRPSYEEHMIRERVDVRGAVRPLESEDELQAIRLFTDHPTLIGTIREGPVRRYLEGQGLWDKKFKRTAKKVEKQRMHNEKLYEDMLKRGAERGLLYRGQIESRGGNNRSQQQKRRGGREVGEKRQVRRGKQRNRQGEEWTEEPHRYGPLDVCLAGETPPPSALAGRRDCEDALALLRTSLQLTAKEAGVVVRKRDKLHEDIFGGPKPSVAEATAGSDTKGRGRRRPHGLDIWVRSMGVFGKKTRHRAFFEDANEVAKEDKQTDTMQGGQQRES